MKIIVAPDSFKGSLSSPDVAKAMAKGFRRAITGADILELPIADGGEGTAEILMSAVGGKKVPTQTLDPLGRKITGYIILLDDGKTAVVEMAVASGLTLLSCEERNPMLTTTYGTGLLIGKALELGVEKILVTIGGSATNDGGMGMAIALGGIFKDKYGNCLQGRGQDLLEVDSINLDGLDRRLDSTEIRVMTDVGNPFYGRKGAAEVYSQQKGATKIQVNRLDQGLKNMAGVIKRQLFINVQELVGSGAAGGLGGGLVAFLGAELFGGVDSVLEMINFKGHLVGADLVVTGEGRSDGQTLNGKTPFGVLSLARKLGVPTIIVSGSIGQGADKLIELGASGIFSIQREPGSLENAMKKTSSLIECFCFNLGKLLNNFK